MFETAERGTDVVRSVTLLHLRFFDASPLRGMDDLFGQPRHTDIPIQHSAFVKDRSRRNFPTNTYTEASNAEVFVFENANLAMKLDLFVSTIEQVLSLRTRTLHYVFQLQVVSL